jgi:hypothetical protein
MAGQNLGKRLVKEFQRGGKKSIVLALLLVGGLCIWTPMLWRKIFRKGGSPPATAAAKRESPSPRPADQQTTVAAPATTAPVEWKSLYRRLEKSPLIQPLPLDELVRDPFENEWVREKTKPIVSNPEPESKPVEDPLRGLVLSAVLAGGDGGAAVINDIVYRIGQKVPEKSAIQYVLKDIRKDRVLLDRAGKVEELLLNDAVIERGEPVEQDK